MTSSFNRFIKWWVPDTAHAADKRKLHFFVEVLMLGTFVGLFTGLWFLAQGLWVAAAPQLAMCVVYPAALASIRAGIGFKRVGNAALLFTLFALVTPIAVERRLDGALIACLTIVPYMAVLLLGTRAAIGWLLGSFAVLSAALMIRDALPVATEQMNPELVTILRAIAFITTVLVVGVRFEIERQSTTIELERTNRAKTAFLANMSHEIRTPMNGVLGMTELMLRGPLEERTRERLLLVHRSGQVLVSLINDILDFSKIEAGKLALDEVAFNVPELITDLQRLYEASAHEKGVMLDMNTLSGVPSSLLGDPIRLRQVLGNLIDNAVKFTERGSVRLTVATEASDRERVRLLFRVQDTGIGIAPDVLPRLFRVFEQGDASTTRRYGGTGLGLSLSQQLVQLMGGQLNVSSQLGIGTEFTFSLLFKRAPATTPVSKTHLIARNVTGKKTALVVDDNLINLKVACGLLEKVGFATDTALNGRQAVEAMQHKSYTVVFMDCHMPEMDGFEATAHIRALPGEAAHVPVIALTASGMPEDIEACRKAGMNDHVVKPLSIAGLQRVLLRVLEDDTGEIDATHNKSGSVA